MAGTYAAAVGVFDELPIAMDIDFKNQTLRVDRAATDDGQVKDTKTHEARTVDLTPDLTATLKRHLTWLRAESLRNGSREPEWLFPRADGTP